MRRTIKRLRRISAHINIICGMVVLTFQILDWYNPYMDFLGHAAPVVNLLCVSAAASGFLCVFGEEPGTGRNWIVRSEREEGAWKQ